MGQQIGDLGPHVILMLVGALLPTVGFAFGARSRRGRALLSTWSRVRMTVAGAILALAAAAGGYLSVTPILDAASDGSTFPPPAILGVLGLAIGLVFALPNVVLVWMDERQKLRERSKKRDYVPTKDDRRAYAADLARQIRELSAKPREVEVSAGGDGERVLMIRGDFAADEGERLTTALRAELKELGFKRVEGSGGRKDWWARV